MDDGQPIPGVPYCRRSWPVSLAFCLGPFSCRVVSCRAVSRRGRGRGRGRGRVSVLAVSFFSFRSWSLSCHRHGVRARLVIVMDV
jgi:hypothetical protein